MRTDSVNQIKIWSFAAVVCGMSLSLPTGCCCIEGDNECDRKTSLYITVEGGEAVNGATVFFFNNDGTYLTSMYVSAEDIAGNVPVVVSYNTRNVPRAVVWGNLGDAELLMPPTGGTSMESLFITMKKDAAGYAIPMDNLFFRAKQLSGVAVEVIEIVRKTGQIAVTVKGLPQDGNAKQYYFTMETAYGDYNFIGSPLADKMILKLPGMFTGNDLVTPEAYHAVDFSSGIGAIVNLYRDDGTGNVQLLASADKDVNNQPIFLLAGQTTNVLIELMGTGEITVSVIITGPDEIYQWNEW